MNRIISILSGGLLMGGLMTGCLQEEIPVAPFDRGDAITSQIMMQPNYRDQIWFDLSENKVVSTNERTAWDLGFGCADSVDLIRLNSSLAASAVIVTDRSFEEVTTKAGLNLRVDHPTGVIDSMALFGLKPGQVAVIDRGYSPEGRPLGVRKLELLSSEPGSYRVRYANLDGTDEQEISVVKDAAYNFLAYSFKTHAWVDIEPAKDAYDICFTTYTHLFYDPDYQPYLVNGVWLNPHETQAYKWMQAEFATMTLADMDTISWSAEWDVIGFDWKSF
ncbi:MAG: HmuY family protein, partial [Bacteroidota bacterium]